LTAKALEARGLNHMTVVLMGHDNKSLASQTNRRLLIELLAPIPVVKIPLLGKNPVALRTLKINSKKIGKHLHELVTRIPSGSLSEKLRS
jgi:hypothetical protein